MKKGDKTRSVAELHTNPAKALVKQKLPNSGSEVSTSLLQRLLVNPSPHEVVPDSGEPTTVTPIAILRVNPGFWSFIPTLQGFHTNSAKALVKQHLPESVPSFVPTLQRL